MAVHAKRIYFRAIEETDIDYLYLWSNDDEINEMLCGWHFPGSKGFIRDWIANQNQDQNNRRFIICNSDDNKPIGTISLVHIDWKNRNAYLGIMIGNKEYQGKGYGEESIKLITDYSFLELDLVRLDTDIIEYNYKSIGLFEKLGWIKEGCKNNFFYRKGKRWHRLSYGIEK
ncbi:GNAT family N-acetyltransferase [Piscirickettsia salmonis]|uniref:GNAT family N-acetyltransferase n=1 Tax=Piscirickettsia salmonis TaxID=1238 RepID=UPI000F09142D|nr:GNAT family N-acetyltransferase [Piscirickettsiaceae bacterium NZ-RLO2]